MHSSLGLQISSYTLYIYLKIFNLRSSVFKVMIVLINNQYHEHVSMGAAKQALVTVIVEECLNKIICLVHRVNDS